VEVAELATGGFDDADFVGAGVVALEEITVSTEAAEVGGELVDRKNRRRRTGFFVAAFGRGVSSILEVLVVVGGFSRCNSRIAIVLTAWWRYYTVLGFVGVEDSEEGCCRRSLKFEMDIGNFVCEGEIALRMVSEKFGLLDWVRRGSWKF
jgi:hypothetical protein